MKNSFKSLLLVSVFALGLSACGGGDDSSSKQDNASSTDTTTTTSAEAEQVLKIGMAGAIKTLDISKATDLYATTVLTKTLEGLTAVTVNDQGNDEIIPAVAKSWETSADGLEWTFHLRDSNWNDGKPVVADDFKYSLMRTLDPKTASTYAFILTPIKNAKAYNKGTAKAEDVGIQVIDDHTIKFTLENPTSYFLNLTAFKTFLPQRKDIVEKNGPQNGSSLETANMGNGPFKLTEWIPSSKLILVKNDKYWDADNVKLTEIKLNVILETTAYNNMLLTGQIDDSVVSEPEWIKKIEATNNFNKTVGYTGGENYGTFNLTDKVFKNTKVRQAFSLSVTREDIANVIFDGMFQPAYGWTPPKLMMGNTEYRSVTPEPLKALKLKYPDPKALLVDGLKELGMDPDPTHLTVTYLSGGTGSFHKKDFAYHQQMWHNALGVNVKGDFVQWPVFLTRLKNQEFQLASLAWTGDYNDPSTFFDIWTSTSGMYNTGFVNKEYDTLIDNARKEVDQDKRLKMFQRAEEILVSEQAAIFPTTYRKKISFTNKRVHNLNSPTFGTSSYKDVYIK